MEIIVNTIQGTFVVPSTKQASLIMWLEANAIKVGQKVVHEDVSEQNSIARQLISE